jgi:ElaB/YqjD/DUF883 family membrane-anchored ribosome-binding protein
MARGNRKNLQTLPEELDVLSAEVSDLVTIPPDDPSLALDGLRKRISRLGADLRKLASDVGSGSPRTVVVMADKIVDPVEDTLSERPLTTIALGFGLGFLMGLAWRRQ